MRGSQFFIATHTSIKETMKQLDLTSEKILFVVDSQEQLIGSVTDGDIRRWILNGGDINQTIDKACNHSPFSISEPYVIQIVKNIMIKERISCIPVLDEAGKIKDLLFWHALFDTLQEPKSHPRLAIPVVIMAGGLGTRLAPFTSILPKPLIPIGDKSVLEVIIDQFRDHAVNHFYISVSYKSKIIKSYFEELSPPYAITYIYEDNPLGTAGCLASLKETLTGPFLVTNCDILIQTDYVEVLEFHQKNKHSITLVASLKHYVIPYGICEIENGGILTKMNEKPEYSFLVNTGMYIVESDTLSLIPPNESFHMTHLIEKVQEHGGKVGVFPISEKSWVDVGEWQEYKKAIESFRL